MIDVVCIGSATLDIFVRSSDFQVLPSGKDKGLVLCETYGAKLEVDNLVFTSGGGATNAAVSFVRKGINARVIAEIGQDMPGGAVLQDLHRDNVNTQWLVQVDGEHTAVSIVLSAPQGGRSIVTDRGASRMLDVQDLPWDQLETTWFYIASTGGRLDVVDAVVKHAKQKNSKIACNPGARELAQLDLLSQIIPQCDVLIINDTEAQQLLRSPVVSVQDLFAPLRNLGPSQIIMTAGDQGAYAITKDHVFFAPPSPTPAIEATGAGDAFGSGYIAGQILGWDIPTSLQLAAANAESVILKIGAKEGLITLEQFDKNPKITVTQL